MTPHYVLSLNAEQMRLLHIAYAIGVLLLEGDDDAEDAEAIMYADTARHKLAAEDPDYAATFNQLTRAMIEQSLVMHSDAHTSMD